MPYKKKLVLISLLFIFSSQLFSKEITKINLNYWNKQVIELDHNIKNSKVNNYKKEIIETNLILPEEFKGKILYLNIDTHTGYTEVYLNNKLISKQGFFKNISKRVYIDKTVTIPPGLVSDNQVNKLKLINYSLNGLLSPDYSISVKNRGESFNRFNIFTFLTVAQLAIVLLYIFTSTWFNQQMKSLDKNYLKLHLLLVLFLVMALLRNLSIFTSIIEPIIIPYLIMIWFFLMQFYLQSFGVWNRNKYSVLSFIISTTILSFYILNQTTGILPDIIYLNGFSYLFINIVAARLLLREKLEDYKFLKTAAWISLILALLFNIVVIITKVRIYIFLELIVTIIIITYNLYLRTRSIILVKSNEQYNSRLLESIEKWKRTIIKKDTEISELKSMNDEILREKTLFFTSLSNNIRTPLNSIIGYSENMYSSNDINEIHSSVTDIIVESDRIYQIINNIMDFSTRNFSNADLLLKDFTMEEIFKNSLSESPNISSFSKYINYKALKNCDKVKIHGNPLIFKQVITSLIHFLIELNPQNIDYTIFNSSYDNNYINLELKLKANNLKKSELSFISTISNYKDTFVKYINLYNVGFNEEMGDDYYSIHLKLQCELAKKSTKEALKEKSTNLVLSDHINVMVVEDYEPNLKIVQMHLEKMGCTVFTATNGVEAVEKFKQENIDLILMDIKMPIMDGWEATEKIREQEKGLETFIIGLTASSLDLDIRHCFESGMDDVQVKPIRKKQLYSKLTSLDKIKPILFPTIGSLRAELSISKLESEMLYKASLNQIDKQLEVLEVLISADDKVGVENEIPAIIHASLNINAFYYARILRNMFHAYQNNDLNRTNNLLKKLKDIADEAKEPYSDLFGN